MLAKAEIALIWKLFQHDVAHQRKRIALTILAILATFLVPALIRQMDKIAGDKESAALKSFGDALQQSIMRTRYIPNESDWISRVAAELGVNVSNVATNARKKPRFFLIDLDPLWGYCDTPALSSFVFEPREGRSCDESRAYAYDAGITHGHLRSLQQVGRGPSDAHRSERYHARR